MAQARAAPQTTEWTGVVSVLSAVDELFTLPDIDAVLKRAVEFSREGLGLERVGIYLSEPDHDPASGCTLRGTWGTGADGSVTDEHGLSFSCSASDYQVFLRMQDEGRRWLYSEDAPLIAQELGQMAVIGQGWMVATPMVSTGRLVGLAFNDAALSQRPIDEGQQVRAAVYFSLLAGLVASRRDRKPLLRPSPRARQSPIVERVLKLLVDDPVASNQRLARAIGISPAHLSRVFKSDMGVSLVEYRNRLRVERFLRLVDDSGRNLLDAALHAGFGSYAQFYRVFYKMVGATPREYVTGRRANPDDSAENPGPLAD